MKFYALRDPRDGRVRWVGSTMKDKLSWRLDMHMACGTKDGPRENWIRELRSLGLRPTIELLQTANVGTGGFETPSPKNVIEYRWMKRMLAAGEPLLTIQRPGYHLPASTRAKMSTAHSARQRLIRAALLVAPPPPAEAERKAAGA